MTFSSLVFLCIFLPVIFGLQLVIPSIKGKNTLLIAGSLLFYAFGEPVYVFLMLFSAFMNYVCARMIEKAEGRDAREKKIVLIVALVLNLGLLAVFKYTGFLAESLNSLLGLSIPVPRISLPIGISFFTFQALSYVIDVYRGQVEAQPSFWKVLLYITFFPQLIAGPIVKYRDIQFEIESRRAEVSDIAAGCCRFAVGLGKKVLIANTMAQAADAVFQNGFAAANIVTAWIGAVAYLMQIYFDFSGYSDMAIGLGRMFGFHFQENFDAPYTALGIRDFWRKWHISLSSWFKEYLYIPLGGNRKGKLRTAINKVVVFLLTGLWHGASWNFVIWGLFHGCFSFLEEYVPKLRGRIDAPLPRRIVLHLYTLLVITVGFVIFRADTLGEAVGMIDRMFRGFDFSPAYMTLALQQLTPLFIVTMAAAVIGCGPHRLILGALRPVAENRPALAKTFSYALAFVVLFLSLLRLSGGAYNPFIYFRF